MSGILLIQSYVATILLFAGLYTATFRFQVSINMFAFSVLNDFVICNDFGLSDIDLHYT